MLKNGLLRLCAIVFAIGLSNDLLTAPAKADLVTFDVGLNGILSINGMDLDGLGLATTSVAGSSFTVSMTAATSSGTFSLGSQGLGIDSPSFFDRNDYFDARGVENEWMDFSFLVSQPAIITVVSVDLDSVSGNGGRRSDRASLNFTGGNTYNIDGTNVDTLDQFSLSESYTAGQNIRMLHVAGNGFRLQAITLDIQLIPVSVPESSSLLVFSGFTGLVVLVRRRRR